jgi:hypothetical protein
VNDKPTNLEPISPEPESLEEMRQEVGEMLELANSGDATAISLLRESMEQCPSLISTFGGDMAKVATSSLIDAITGKRVSQKEAILQQLKSMQLELAGPAPSPTEKLLVDRVVVCWLQVQHADHVAQAGDVTLPVGDYLQRRQDRSHRRFLTAVKMLATVRRLALPIRVDLNVEQRLSDANFVTVQG